MTLTPDDFTRYARQLALPEITPAQQARLKNARVVMIGAGGLGAPALPYLAGAGIGHITIIDHDDVDVSNLHRQTIYTASQSGQSKAQLAAAYLQALNPAIEVRAIIEKLTAANAASLCAGADLILDGSDNFATKYLLNETAIRTQTPLISASVEQFKSVIGIFVGNIENAPCYACLFPSAPENACNCNDAGVLGTAAGLAGMYQAHLALLFLLGIGDIKPGTILSLDFKDLRLQNLTLTADPECSICRDHKAQAAPPAKAPAPIALVPLAALTNTDYAVIDVRNADELIYDPIHGAIHIPLPELHGRISEIPRNKTIALVCAGNVRSRMGAEMLCSFGFENICVLDRFSFTDRAA